jgi:protein-tyrosine phosphatase
MTGSEPTAILFVCMGNICRSPLAEGVFRHKIAARGVEDRFFVDSAGTGDWHAGEPADARMRAVAGRHGIELTSAARVVVPDDFTRFDHLVCADEINRRTLLARGAPEDRTQLLLSFDPDTPVREVPDPYEGGIEGFELVFDLVDAACDHMIERLLRGGVDGS